VYDYHIPYVYFSTVLILILIALSMFIDKHWITKSWKCDEIMVVMTALFFVVAGVGIVTQAIDQIAGWYRLITIIIFSRFVLWLWLHKNMYSVSYIMKYISLGLIPLVVLGVVQVLLGHTLGIKIIGEWSFSASNLGVANVTLFGFKTLRAYATFPHPNVFGAVMAIFSLYWANQWIERSDFFVDKWTRFVPYFLGIFFVGMILSFSLTAWIAFFAGAVFYVPRMWQKGSMRFNGGWSVIVFVFGLLFVSGLSYALVRLFSVDALSLTRRMALNDVAVRMFLDHPIFGVGLNQSILLVSSYWNTAFLPQFVQPTHNAWLLMLSEVGILGMVLIVATGYQIIVRRFLILPTFVRAMWVAIFVMTISDHYLVTLQSGLLLLFLTIGITLRYDVRSETT